ncbi:MAG: hypothetical protein ACK5GG_06345 [Betaproteobacteria bacterium]
MKLFISLALWAAAQTASAHEGHGDTHLHALAHFVEGNGIAIWLAIIVIGGLGLYRATRQRSRNK